MGFYTVKLHFHLLSKRRQSTFIKTFHVGSNSISRENFCFLYPSLLTDIIPKASDLLYKVNCTDKLEFCYTPLNPHSIPTLYHAVISFETQKDSKCAIITLWSIFESTPQFWNQMTLLTLGNVSKPCTWCTAHSMHS